MILHSSNVLWLISALPVWYFSTVAHPLAAGIFSLIPSVGTLGLAGGVFGGIIRQRRALGLFLCPFLLSEAFIGVAGANWGRLRGNASALPLCLFMLAQVVLLSFVVYRTRKAVLVSVVLSIFSLTYALFAAFVGGMALADDWL